MDGYHAVALGTWRSVIVADAKRFIKISKEVPVAMAATLSVNPPTAYRMMKCFIDMKSGGLEFFLRGSGEKT